MRVKVFGFVMAALVLSSPVIAAKYSNYHRAFYDLPQQSYQATGERLFVFSPRLKRWAAYNESGERVGYGVANGGSHWCAELGRPCRTPKGIYRVHRKGAASCRSSKYPLGKGGAPMPYCMFFHKGYAIHGSPKISDRNGSHGCVRVQTDAAKWLHRHFIKHGTQVVILPYSS